MDKVKRLFRFKSLKSILAVYIIVYIVLSMALSLFLSNICQWRQSKLNIRDEKEFIVNFTANNKEWVHVPEDRLSEYEYDESVGKESVDTFGRMEYEILGILTWAVYPVCFVGNILIISILFYKQQLQKPLEVLNTATENIASHNLDFEIPPMKQNELGKLCGSFDFMRSALMENYKEMWRQIEEREKLNAAFSHDLRTPLTVLKGQSEMLIKYAPQMKEEKVVSIASMMQRHIVRLENYVNTMSELHRLEDIKVERKPVAVPDLLSDMEKTAHSVCREKEIIFSVCSFETEALNIDFPIVIRVFENLLSNAMRFAAKSVCVSIDVRHKALYLTVKDDGRGFQKEELEHATKPFYKGMAEMGPGHFGMGLGICKIFCEKHGGCVELWNDGGAVVMAPYRD